MTKRLLFVDDEKMVLDGLRRALHGMRNEWDMRFVDGPIAALELLEQEPFDAVISDMRMPKMDGAELLERIKERHPNVVRFILSGQSKKETILRSVSPAHQFLSKPCDVQELRRRLDQAFATRDLLENPALATTISRLRSIPSLPTLYTELTQALQSEDTSLVEIERIISKDVGMAAKILQLANSAFMGAHNRVSSIREAVSLIGAETVRSLTLSINVFSQFEQHSSAAMHLPALWDHSVAVAALAQKVALLETSNKALSEESFTAGLLHDVGKIVLLAEMPKEYEKVLYPLPADDRRFQKRELDFVGCSHQLVGAYLMSIWGLPMPIIQAVRFHHGPSEVTHSGFTALTAVHWSDAMISALDTSPLNHDGELEAVYFASLGLSEHVTTWKETFKDYLQAAGDRAAKQP
jgi:putative nucleotidyltransferase with HDIG domain